MPDYVLAIIISCCALVLALIAILIIVLVVKNKKKNSVGHVKVDNEFIENILKLLGGKENIKSVSVDNARLKFDVNDLDVVDLNGLKAISSNGVFVTGYIIKTLFKFESKDIKKEIDKLL